MVCALSSSTSDSVLSFSWDLPTLRGDEVVSYQVVVNRLEHRTGTREVIQSGVYNQFVKERDANVPGLGMNAHTHRRQLVLCELLNIYSC